MFSNSNPRLISIVIPTYNRAQLLVKTLYSVLAQTYVYWECIVVDDGSTDDTKEIINGFMAQDARIKYFKRPKAYKAGGNGARNYGFTKCKGQFVQWFDDDDIMLPNYLSDRVCLFNDSIQLVIGSGFRVDEDLQNKTYYALKETLWLYKDYAFNRALILTPSVLFKKSFLDAKPLFDENLTRGQEMAFYLTLFFKLDPNQYVILNEGLFLYRAHNQTKTNADLVYHKPFKESQTTIYIDNLKRSILIQDKDLIIMFYRQLIQYFILGIRFGHFTNSRRILSALKKHMSKISKWLYFELLIWGHLALWFKYPSYQIHKRLKHHNALLNI